MQIKVDIKKDDLSDALLISERRAYDIIEFVKETTARIAKKAAEDGKRAIAEMEDIAPSQKREKQKEVMMRFFETTSKANLISECAVIAKNENELIYTSILALRGARALNKVAEQAAKATCEECDNHSPKVKEAIAKLKELLG